MALTLLNVNVILRSKILVQDFSLDVAAGEIVTLMGPSGSGKSALLSCIAGQLAAPFHSTGEIWLNGQRLNDVPPERRAMGRLFQDDWLFPHLSVGQNVLFGMAQGPAAARQMLVEEALAAHGLAGFFTRAPDSLSGGQRQRVALLRALLAGPKAMLLDEPFSKLDMALRGTIRAQVFTSLQARNIPCLLVTHDRQDAPPGGKILLLNENGEVRHA